MKRLATAVLIVASLTGCNIRINGTPGWDGGNAVRGSGKRVIETRTTNAYSGVVLDAAADVDVQIGDKRVVVIEGDDNLLPLITTEVKEGQLIIASRENYRTEIGIKVHLTTPELESASIAGAGSIRIEPLESRKFAASVSGSGNIEIERLSGETFEATLPGSGNINVKNLKAKQVVATIDGSGAIELAGWADQLEASLDGSGNLQLGELTTKYAAVSVAGSGNADVHATDKLDGAVAGSGSIHYAGKPKVVKRDITGSGSIEPN